MSEPSSPVRNIIQLPSQEKSVVVPPTVQDRWLEFPIGICKSYTTTTVVSGKNEII